MTTAERMSHALARLQQAERAYHAALGEVQTLALAIAGRITTPLPDAQAILDQVGDVYDLPTSVIMGRSRTAAVVEARTIALYLATTLTGHPASRLDRAFGLTHRATANAIERARARLQTDRQFRQLLGEIEAGCRHHLRTLQLAS